MTHHAKLIPKSDPLGKGLYDMKNKVRRNVKDIVDVLSSWSAVRAVVLQHFAEKDVYDPGFSVTLDVFLDGEIPDRDQRADLFPRSEYFESSRINNKDRFIMQELPVRISYKDCKRVDMVLSAVDTDDWLSYERDTYLFHRIATGTLEWNRDDWMNTILRKLDELPESLWRQWIDSCQRRIDHYLGDLGAASMKDDPLYFQISLAGFLKSMIQLLSAINHVFEPGPRDYSASLALLEEVPEGFEANWSSLLRADGELPAYRKHEIAEILARGVFAMNP